MKRVVEKWAWLPLVLVVMCLLVALVIVIRHRNTTRISPFTSQASINDTQIAKRDGKTEQLTLISQKGSFPYTVDVVSTEASREKGLSGRDGLSPNNGMLFVFAEPGFDCFWMKDMKFDIDMLWFDQYQSLVHIQENATTSTFPSSFCPQTAARYVLEVPVGTVKQLGLRLGDRFTTL